MSRPAIPWRLRTAAVLLLAGLFGGCSTLGDCEDEAGPSGPAPKQSATKRTASPCNPNDWRAASLEALEGLLRPEALIEYVKLPAAADRLLAEADVGPDVSPVVQARIAAVTAVVTCPTYAKAPAARVIWSGALLRAATDAKTPEAQLFFLGQLRWCGRFWQADAVRALAKSTDRKDVAALAERVAKELK